jgi:PIN domain nuclease of toxin-antitoxin system
MHSGEMNQPILLDTCAAVFLVAEELKPTAIKILEYAEQNNIGLYISPITAWEIGILVARNRLMLTKSPDLWFAAILESGFTLAEMGPNVLIASSFLPSATLRDQADRIIAATARTYDYRLMTRDRPLLDYAAQGHLKAIAC